MTPDEIIRMAREAGFEVGIVTGAIYAPTSCELQRFTALAAAAEREACADVCDQHATCEGIAQECAAAIRERGESK